MAFGQIPGAVGNIGIGAFFANGHQDIVHLQPFVITSYSIHYTKLYDPAAVGLAAHDVGLDLFIVDDPALDCIDEEHASRL